MSYNLKKMSTFSCVFLLFWEYTDGMDGQEWGGGGGFNFIQALTFRVPGVILNHGPKYGLVD